MNFPDVLAGPVVRKAGPDSVCFWLSTSKPASIKATIYTLLSGQLTHVAQSNVGDSVQLGDKLFVHVINVMPEQGSFPEDQLLYYDLTLDGQALDAQFMRSVSYGELPYPSFFIPGKLNNIIYGSCRKPHAATDGAPAVVSSDHLSVGDQLIEENHGDLGKRPSALFLMGDQIYADDMAGPLLAYASRVGRELLGWQEYVPGQNRQAVNPCPSVANRLYERNTFLTGLGSCFTSTEAYNHLMTFGEFAAVYLMALGGNVASLPDWGDVSDICAPEDQAKYEKELRAVTGFVGTAGKVRRLLANIPTYMILDDHEVTDDWNLNGQWVQNTSASKVDKRIISNALAAYWAFQGWGNSPESFSDSFIKTITGYLAARGTSTELQNRYEESLLGKKGWGYVIDSFPRVVVLDTRTQRGFSGSKSPPKLIDAAGLKDVASQCADINGKPLVIISATPVYGFEPIEMMQKILVAFGVEPSALDFESWIANRDGFGGLMMMLARELAPEWVVFLSGDVHYSFATKAEFQVEDKVLRVWQLTSSPLKNDTKNSQILEKLSGTETHTERRFGWDNTRNVPRHIRLLRPLFDLFVRWNILRPNPRKTPIWLDTLNAIKPGNRNVVMGEYNLGHFVMEFDPDHEQVKPVVQKLYTYTDSGDVETVTYEL